MSSFRKAERKKSKLRLGLSGPAGSGKTYSALRLAKGIGGRICMIDTEHGSGELYSDEFDYDVAQLSAPYSPERYIELIRIAEKENYDIIIIDSLSHAWAGQGGVLEIHSEETNASRDKNAFTAWNKVTPRQTALVEYILSSSLHIIATLRAKTVYELQEDGKGKKKPVKIGLSPIQRLGTDYEFTFFLLLDKDTHIATVDKCRGREFDGMTFLPTEDTGEMLRMWLDKGVEPVVGYYDIKTRFGTASSVEDLKSIMDSYKDDIAKLSDPDKALLRQAYAKRKDELSTLADKLFGGINA